MKLKKCFAQIFRYVELVMAFYSITFGDFSNKSVFEKSQK